MTVFAAGALVSLAVAALVFAALHDVAVRTIPNWVPVALAGCGLGLRLQAGDALAGTACGLAVFVLSAFCWGRGWLGGGDVKLLGASALLVPPAFVPGYVAAVALAGGGLAMIYLVLARLLPVPRLARAPFLRRVLAVECRRIRRRESLPYAAAIATAVVLTLAKV